MFVVAKGSTGNARQHGEVTANFGLCRNARVQNITVDLDGVRYPDTEQDADFQNNQFSAFYQQFRRACQVLNGNDCSMTSSEYKDLFTVFAIDTSIKPLKIANSTSNMAMTIRRKSVPADDATASDPLNVDYYVISLNEKSYDVNCAEKIVTSSA